MKTLDDVMKELGIKICPICGCEYTERPALSRKDNETEICPLCGLKEAMDDYEENKSKQEKNSGYFGSHLFCGGKNEALQFKVEIIVIYNISSYYVSYVYIL